MQNQTNGKRSFQCNTSSDVPKEPHWAILVTRSGIEKGYDPGDPDTTYHFMTYYAYLDKDEWEKEIIKRTEENHKAYTKVPFIAMEVKPATINTTVAVSLG